MTEGLALLRKPFLPHQISKLPKPTKKQTEELRADFKKGVRCKLCGGWHQSDVIHLDYVGHAALTDRLLDADAAWVWEPLSMSDGLPVMDNMGGMWIKLTVCGVTRLGYGHAGEKTGGDAIKEVIGDALRNAAMRFGAALDLWHKGDLHIDDDGKDQKKDDNDNGSPGALMFKELQPDIQDMLRKAAPQIDGAMPHVERAMAMIEMCVDQWPDADPQHVKSGLWHLLKSNTRSAIKAHTKAAA
jgi:hypothetical protein